MDNNIRSALSIIDITAFILFINQSYFMSVMSNVVVILIGLTVLFVLLGSVIMPFYNTAGGISQTVVYNSEQYNRTGTNAITTTTGMSNAMYQGILLLIFIMGIIGVAMTFFRRAK